MEIIKIKTDEIKPNSYNPNIIPLGIMAKLRAEIARKGLCKPIIVRKGDTGYEIVDGEHRWQICRELGWQEIPCIVQEYDDNEAKIKTLQLNYMKGVALPVRLAHLIHDLNREIKIEELEKLLPYEKTEINDSLELLKLTEDCVGEFAKGEEQSEEEPFIVWTAILRKEEARVVDRAIEEMKKYESIIMKNSKALALEMLCRYFLMDKGVKLDEDELCDEDIDDSFRDSDIGGGNV
jgi:ParB/RepB/Spo0J family partition protein